MFQVITSKPIALDSPDHIEPYGSIYGNSTNDNFNQLLYKLFDGKQFSLIDFGCAGGGFIWCCTRDGYLFVVGLEGSDVPVNRNVGQWPELNGKNLFLCDVTEPFTILLNDKPFIVDIITSWEFLEHIDPDKIDMVLQNTVDHLKDDGLYICSISSGTRAYCDYVYGKLAGPYRVFNNPKFNHQNQNTPEYWDEKFKSFGFIKRDDIKASFNGQFVRAPGIGCSDWATEERIMGDLSGMPADKQEATLNRVYQLKRNNINVDSRRYLTEL